MGNNPMNGRRKGTEIGRVRGLGSAHHGAGHWHAMHVTSAASLVTCAYLAFSFVLLPDFSYLTIRQWLAGPIPSLALVLLIIGVFRHTQLGLQVLFEDYLHGGARYAVLLVINLLLFASAAFGLVCIAKVVFGAMAEATTRDGLAAMQQAMQSMNQGGAR